MALEYGIDINKGIIIQREEENKLKRKISLPNLHQRKSIIDQIPTDLLMNRKPKIMKIEPFNDEGSFRQTHRKIVKADTKDESTMKYRKGNNQQLLFTRHPSVTRKPSEARLKQAKIEGSHLNYGVVLPNPQAYLSNSNSYQLIQQQTSQPTIVA